MSFRWYYVDDSGATNTGWVVYGYVEVPAECWGAAFGRWLDFRRLLYEQYRIPASYELHAHNFINGRGNPSQRVKWNRDKELRRRLAVSALQVIAEMPGVRVGAVVRHTEARRDAYAEERQRVYGELVERLTTRLERDRAYGAVVIDGDGSDVSYEQRHADLDMASRRILENPIFHGAHASPMLQVADLVSYAAYQAVRRDPEKAFMHDWFDSHLAARGDINGV
jgi:hypothetical protein